MIGIRSWRCAGTLITALASLVIGRPALAEMLTFSTAPASTLTFSVDMFDGGLVESATFNVAGTLVQDQTFATQGGFGLVATSAQLKSANLALSGADPNFDFDLGFQGTLSTTVANLVLSATGPSQAFIPPPTAAGTTKFSLSGSSLVLNSGTITYTGEGTVAGVVGTNSLNFANFPLELEFPASAQMTVVVTPQGSGQLVTATLPLTGARGVFSTDPELYAIGISLGGNLVLTATRGTGSTLVGDANGDCSVGAADYTIWAAQFGQTGAGLTADFDGNGSVGAADYALWAANFGNTCPPALSAVPEPSTLGLAGAALACWVCGYRRRARGRAERVFWAW